MVGLDPRIENWLRSAYSSSSGEVDFIAVLAQFDVSEDDEQLAELIELDGKVRIQLNKPVTLARYLDDTPGLHHKPVSLDAAIDLALRSMSGSSRPTQDAVRILAEQFPGIQQAILNAAMLAEAMGSTTGLHEKLGLAVPRELPAPFGPLLENGQARYELVQLLGQGGGGEVYLAEDRKLSDPTFKARVAIKIVPYRSQTGWARRQLIEEATKARRVEHPHTVKVLDRGVAGDGEEYVVSEYVDGPNLDVWTQQQGLPLDPMVAARIVAQIARGVQAAHAAGLVHCDLKPSNVLMSPAGPKVADFGIAVLAEDGEQSRAESQKHPVIGSLAFMSPEQYRGEGVALTIPSDIYALGGMLFYLLTGRLPNGATPEEISKNHELRSSGTIVEREPSLAKLDLDLAAICRRALRPDRADRHNSAGELAEDLERWGRFEPIPWTNPHVARTTRLWTKRNPKLVRAIAVSSLLLIVTSVFAGRMMAVAKQQQIKADAATGTIDSSLSALKRFYAQMKARKADALSKDLLPQSMAWELIHGSLFLGQPGSRTDAWRDRVQAVQSLIQKNIDQGNGETLETALWQMTLGYWFLNEKRPSDAIAPLEASLAVWSRGLQPTDPALEECREWLAAAKVLTWQATAGPVKSSAQSPEVLDAARVVIEASSVKPRNDRPPLFWESAQKAAVTIQRASQ